MVVMVMVVVVMVMVLHAKCCVCIVVGVVMYVIIEREREREREKERERERERDRQIHPYSLHDRHPLHLTHTHLYRSTGEVLLCNEYCEDVTPFLPLGVERGCRGKAVEERV